MDFSSWAVFSYGPLKDVLALFFKISAQCNVGLNEVLCWTHLVYLLLSAVLCFCRNPLSLTLVRVYLHDSSDISSTNNSLLPANYCYSCNIPLSPMTQCFALVLVRAVEVTGYHLESFPLDFILTLSYTYYSRIYLVSFLSLCNTIAHLYFFSVFCSSVLHSNLLYVAIFLMLNNFSFHCYL